MALIKTNKPKEGEILNKWINNRMIRNNKNVLMAVTGSTGSGKSYWCLAMAQSWYQYHFKKDYPVDTHICFSVTEVMMLIRDGKLKKGELIIFEEAGVNMGSLDFQSKVSKLFNYILQSFRSMNIGIIFNLPYLTMMNKQARTLIHCQFVTHSINRETTQSFCKGFFSQVNAQTGKVYDKFLRVNIANRTRKIKKFGYHLPSEHLLDVYEKKKSTFLSEITNEYTKHMEDLEKDRLMKQSRDGLSKGERRVYKYILEGYTAKQIAEILKIRPRSVYDFSQSMKAKGFEVKYSKNAKEIEDNEVQT